MAWLLMLAIPAQGYAAAAMVFCGTGHHSAIVKVASPNLPASHAHAASQVKHDHAGMHMTHSDGDTSMDISSAGYRSHDASSKVGVQKIAKLDGSGKCSVCASCCNGSVMVSAFIHVAPQSVPSVLNTAPAFGVVGFIPSGLERPPRTTLA